MKSKNIFLAFSTMLLLLFTACSGGAQTSKTASDAGGDAVSNTAVASNATIEIIQFHTEHRCMTCNKIEELSRKTLDGYPNIPFSLVNVDDAANLDQAEAFEAFGTSLFLYNPKTGAKKDLTDFAFMNAGKEEVFIEELKKEIELFSKS